MYQPSTNYTEYIAQSRIRKPKSKIVVDGTEYTGETALKIFPKINHCTSDVLGVFPAKTCEFEIYNKEGNLILNGKEVAVYRGFDIDGTVEWIPMGLFSGKNEDIINNSTAKTITFKGYDRTIMFDVPFNPLNHTYPCTLGDFASQLCKNHAISLETRNFPFSDLILNQAPVVTLNVTERELISRIAELGGCIVTISRAGGLRITKPIETSLSVFPEKYKSFSYEKLQMITKIVISQTDHEDVFQTADSETIGTYGTVVYCIKDNPFIVDRQSEVITSVANEIIGLQTRAFILTDFIDDFLFDLNDIISVKDKNGNDIKVVLRSLQTQSRIKSNFSAESLKNTNEERTSLAGSQKQQNEQQKENLKNFEDQMQQAVKDLSKNMNNALGLYSTEKINKDGSKIIYFHDKSLLEISTYIFTVNSEGFAWVSGSGCWNGGAPNWQYGVDSEGGGILSTLLVRELTANVIKTGVLKSSNSPNTYYDLDKGEFNSSSSKTESVVDAISGETVTRTTRSESVFVDGVFTLSKYVNEILLYTVTIDHNSLAFDHSPSDLLSEEEKFNLSIPLSYYELSDTTLRRIYLGILELMNQVTDSFSSGLISVSDSNNAVVLGKKGLMLRNVDKYSYYTSSKVNVPNVEAGEKLTLRGSNVYSLGKPDGIISQGEYLHEYKIPGVFTVDSNEIAQLLYDQVWSDMPCNMAGKLVVSYALSNSSSDGAWNYIRQTYFPYNNDGYYSRWLYTKSEPDIWTENSWCFYPAYESKPADYIVEQGTDGIWTYRKWASGIAECWGVNTIKFNTAMADNGNYAATGEMITVTLPDNLFNQSPVVSLTPMGGGYSDINIGNIYNTHFTVSFRTEWAVTDMPNWVQCICYGRWK